MKMIEIYCSISETIGWGLRYCIIFHYLGHMCKTCGKNQGSHLGFNFEVVDLKCIQGYYILR